jgi:hypothetical protein
MKGQELIIKFEGDMAFLTEEVALDFNQVNISNTPVKFKAEAFWTVRVINYNEIEKRLFVEILDYQVGETEFPSNQIQLSDKLIEIEKVGFKSIDTPAYLTTLNRTQPIKILPPKQEIVYRQETRKQPEIETKREPVIKTYTKPFFVPIKDITFLNGSVAFEKKIQELKKTVEFQIPNDNIIEQYDAVKNYFASVLKTKKIEVVPTTTTVDGVISSISATSIEIEKIDKTLIEEVKFEFVNVARRKESLDDKQLFTIDEYLKTFAGEDFKDQNFFKDEIDFFENLLEKSETKHYKHLRFLSSKQRHDLLKLRIVHKPFSYVFLLSGTNNFHFVWETLDTQEATYIWTYPNDINRLKEFLTHTDKTINLILKEKKIDYIGRKEENFNRVFHDYTDNGFKNWKDLIEEVITV